MAPKGHGSSGSNDKVKLETMARIKSIPWAKRSNDFAVMVRVTAPPRHMESPRAALDLVAVLDVSGSMRSDNRMESMKQAMVFVIENLGPDDRLSVVSFNDKPRRRTELSAMSHENRGRAKEEVDALEAGGEDDMGLAMEEAAKILRQRTPEERRNRVGRIIFLSDGVNEHIFNQYISPEFPAQTFGLGAHHDPKGLRYIADKTHGVYSYINQDLAKMKAAFAQSLGGLMSITAMDIEIQLKTHQGVTISSIESGAYKNDKQSGTIQIHDMYAGEQKSFIVFLTIPERTKKLMTVSGSFRNPEISNGASIPLDDSEVAVARPWLSIFSDETVDPRVAAEIVRLQLVKDVSAIGDEEHPSGDRLQRLWDKIRDSEDGRKAPEPTLTKLGKEVASMKKEGRPFVLSWLTSHLWQRATTKGSPSESRAFQIPAMKELVGQADDNLEPEPEPAITDPIPTPGKVKVMWDKATTCAAKHPYSCALACVALLLLAGALLITMLQKGSPATVTTTTTVIIPDQNITIRPSPDISKHEGWLKVEKSLEVVMLKKMEDAGITSFLHRASAEDMSQATSRYLLLALVHASILGNRCASAPTIALLEEEVKRLKAEKMELSAKIEALAKEAEQDTEKRAACKDNDEALERANTRIVELARQLENKKTLADSLMADVANADESLKTCNQRVSMLEDKVRETEGGGAVGQ